MPWIPWTSLEGIDRSDYIKLSCRIEELTNSCSLFTKGSQNIIYQEWKKRVYVEIRAGDWYYRKLSTLGAAVGSTMQGDRDSFLSLSLLVFVF